MNFERLNHINIDHYNILLDGWMLCPHNIAKTHPTSRQLEDSNHHMYVSVSDPIAFKKFIFGSAMFLYKTEVPTFLLFFLYAYFY